MTELACKRPKVDASPGYEAVPDEIWLRILSMLDQNDKIQISQTSRRFNRLCKDSTLWRCVRLDFESVETAASSLADFLGQLTSVERILVTNQTYESYSEKVLMSVLLKAKHSLKQLDVSPEVVLKNDTVVRLAALEHLESLDLSGDNIISTGLAALSKLRQLKQLRLYGLEKVTPRDLKTFFLEGPGSLELLDVADSRKAMTNAPVTELAKNNHGLKHLVLDECDSISDPALKALATNCPGLEHLSLEGCYLLNDSSIVRLAKSCPSLRSLSLGTSVKKFLSMGLCGSAVKDTGIKALADNCKQLEHLNLFGATFVTEKGLRYLLNNCPSLRYLQIQGILGISAQFLQDTKTGFPYVEVDYFQKQHARRHRGRNSD